MVRYVPGCSGELKSNFYVKTYQKLIHRLLPTEIFKNYTWRISHVLLRDRLWLVLKKKRRIKLSCPKAGDIEKLTGFLRKESDLHYEKLETANFLLYLGEIWATAFYVKFWYSIGDTGGIFAHSTGRLFGKKNRRRKTQTHYTSSACIGKILGNNAYISEKRKNRSGYVETVYRRVII